MENQDKVLINLDEYKEFVISQYENGKLKKTLISEIKELEGQVNESYKNLNEFIGTLQTQKYAIMKRLFKDSHMGMNSREEQTKIENHKYSWSFGFEEKDRQLLKLLGFNDKDMVEYINYRWDEKEKAKEETQDES